MELSKEKIGEIAMLALIEKIKEEGLMLRPKEVKRQTKEVAQKLGIDSQEFAQFCVIVYEKIYTRTMSELNKMIEEK